MITSNSVYNKLETDVLLQNAKESLIQTMKDTVVVSPSSTAHYPIDPDVMYMDIVHTENKE